MKNNLYKIYRPTIADFRLVGVANSCLEAHNDRASARGGGYVGRNGVDRTLKKIIVTIRRDPMSRGYYSHSNGSL